MVYFKTVISLPLLRQQDSVAACPPELAERYGTHHHTDGN